MESVIRRYFEGCNEGSVDKIASCLLPDAIHYFPPGMYEGPFRGAQTIPSPSPRDPCEADRLLSSCAFEPIQDDR